MRVFRFIAVLALSGLITPALAAPLSGRQFEAAFIGGAPVSNEKAPTLAFEGTQASGNGGCNQFSATATDRGRVTVERRKRKPSLRIAKGPLRIGSVSSTRMYCGPGSAQEARFFDLLGKTRSYRMRTSELRLYSGGRRPRLLMVLRAAD